MSVRVAVVDEQNRFLRWTDRAEVHASRLPHRSAQVLLFDGAGRLVLQRRHMDKRTHPGCWDVSASGHVEWPDYPDPAHPDEQLDAIYDAVAARELEEELGVRLEGDRALTRLAAFSPEPGVHYEHLVLYRGTHDGPYVPQATEVAEIAAFDRAGYEALMASDAPRTPSLAYFVGWAHVRGLF